MTLASAYLESAIKRFREHKALGEKAVSQLRDDELHFEPNAASNSIATIIQHLQGNMKSRWTHFLTEDGEKPWRNRDAEFRSEGLSRETLMANWEEGWKVLLDTLESLEDKDLLSTITIRSQPLIVVDAINRQLAHYSYHVGQMVYVARWIRSGEWQSLSIPKGGSEQFNQEMKSRH